MVNVPMRNLRSSYTIHLYDRKYVVIKLGIEIISVLQFHHVSSRKEEWCKLCTNSYRVYALLLGALIGFRRSSIFLSISQCP